MININTDHQYFCTTMTVCKHRMVYPTIYISRVFKAGQYSVFKAELMLELELS